MAERSLSLFPFGGLHSDCEPWLGVCDNCRQVFRKGKRLQRYCSVACYGHAKSLDVETRFWGHVEKTATCWLWTGSIGTRGYGFIHVRELGKSRTILVHRYAYILHSGSIPARQTLDHLCRIRHCVNPAHLEVVSRWENVRRGNTITGNNMRKIVCKHGHVFDTENTYIDKNGGRHCLACQEHRDRAYKAKKRLAREAPV